MVHVFLAFLLSLWCCVFCQTLAGIMQVQPEEKPDQVVEAKPPLLTRFKDALMHYYHGFRLLFLELKITARLLGKAMKGKSLSRREKKQVKLLKWSWGVLVLLIVRTGVDSNDKPTAMRSRSMARSQYWTKVLIRTGSLSTPDVKSTSNNQPWKKACCWIPIRVHPHLPGLTLYQYGVPQQAFFSGLIVTCTVNIWCTKRSGPYHSCFLLGSSVKLSPSLKLVPTLQGNPKYMLGNVTIVLFNFPPPPQSTSCSYWMVMIMWEWLNNRHCVVLGHA